MGHTMHAAAVVALVAVAACTKTSDNPPMVTAPVTSGSSPAAAPPVASAPAPAESDAGTATGDDMLLGPGSGGEDAPDAASAPYRACKADADCTAVPRVGCCHNGWLEAVNTKQKDAYAKSFVCPTPRPICPMFIVHDTRTPRCDPATHMCTMVNAHP